MEQAEQLTGFPTVREVPRVQVGRRGRQRAAVLGRMLAGADLLAVSAAAGTAIIASRAELSEGLPFVGIAAVLWPAIAFAFGLYSGDDLRSWVSGVSEIPRALVAALLFTWPLFGAASVLGLPSPAVLTAWTLLTTVVLSGAGRAAVRAGLHKSPALWQRTLILGSGVVAGQLVQKLSTHKQFGLLPIGIVDDEVHDVGTPELPRLGALRDLDEILDLANVDRVIIAFSRSSHDRLLECIRACRDHGVAVDVIPRLFELLNGVRSLDNVGGLPLLPIGTPRLAHSSRIAKRLLDIALSTTSLIALAPLLGIIAIAIRIDSPGPVFFRQPRAGRHRRVFHLIKFRSMYADADSRKAEYARQNDIGDGVMFKIHHDPRVTRVGRVLRRFSLDELPQLFNVLKGEMSLVGPRPLILPETDALAEEWHLRRLALRPGLTGPWQVYGRSETPFQEMVSFDYQYVTGWSLARDIEILLATVPAVLSGRGAY